MSSYHDEAMSQLRQAEELYLREPASVTDDPIDLSDHACPYVDCGFDGPHPYWPVEAIAECGSCMREFTVTGPESETSC